MSSPTLVDPGPIGLEDGFEQVMECVEVRDETHDVRSFVFRPALPLRFEPGQYLTVSLDVAGERLSRCYTIASSPTRPDTVTITVKRVPGGPFSNHLHDSLGVGDRVVAAGPSGRFSMARHPAAKYLFLSAGSGITPLMSMTRAAADAQIGRPDVTFVHSARTPADLIFRAELDELAERFGVRVVQVCETDSADEQWAGPRGRLDLATLRQAVPDLHEREVFSCGPPPYMAAVRDLLEAAGVDPTWCHEESFDFSDPACPEFSAATGTSFAVELRRSGRTLDCPQGTSILAAAAEAGVSLPSMCAEGVCGTCKTLMLSGSVEMNHQGGIRPREVAQNKILPCCSTPTEDVVLDC